MSIFNIKAVKSAQADSEDFVYLTTEQFAGRGRARVKQSQVKYVKDKTGAEKARCLVDLEIIAHENPDAVGATACLFRDPAQSFHMTELLRFVGAASGKKSSACDQKDLDAFFAVDKDGEPVPRTTFEREIGVIVSSVEKNGNVYHNPDFVAIDKNGNEIPQHKL